MALSKRTRYEVLRRDNNTCRYCGGSAPDVVLTVDHVTPVALGGSDKPDNLVAACKDCNAGKTSVQPGADLVADVAQDAVRWAAAIKTAVSIRASARTARDEYVGAANDKWLTYMWGQKPVPRDVDWRQSVQKFYELGFPLDELVESIEIACGRRKVDPEQMWRYMCGVAWKKISEIQEVAKSVIVTPPEPVESDYVEYGEGWDDATNLAERDARNSDLIACFIDRRWTPIIGRLYFDPERVSA